MYGRVVGITLALAALIAALTGLIVATLSGPREGITAALLTFVLLSIAFGLGMLAGPPPTQMPLPRRP